MRIVRQIMLHITRKFLVLMTDKFVPAEERKKRRCKCLFPVPLLGNSEDKGEYSAAEKRPFPLTSVNDCSQGRCRGQIGRVIFLRPSCCWVRCVLLSEWIVSTISLHCSWKRHSSLGSFYIPVCVVGLTHRWRVSFGRNKAHNGHSGHNQLCICSEGHSQARVWTQQWP